MLSPTYQLLPPLTRDHFVWRETIFYFHNIYLVLDFGQKRFPQSENQTKAKFFWSKKTWQIGTKKTTLWRRNSSERRGRKPESSYSWGHAWRNLKYGSYKACERYGQKKGKQTKRLFPNNIKDILGGTFIRLNAQKTSRKGLWKNYTSN